MEAKLPKPKGGQGRAFRRAAEGGLRPLTAFRLRKKRLPRGKTALSAELAPPACGRARRAQPDRAPGVRCAPPSGGGSHYKVSHASRREILTVPFRWPIKAIYIRKLVRFIDAVRDANEKA
jgi:hypothetical protein